MHSSDLVRAADAAPEYDEVGEGPATSNAFELLLNGKRVGARIHFDDQRESVEIVW